MNNSFSNQDPLEPFQQNQHHVNFRNVDHALHVQSFYAWLHPDLRDLPGIDWAEMPGTVTGYLVNAVGDSPYAPHIALAVGTALGYFAPSTLRVFAAGLNTLLNTIRTHCGTWNGTDLTREVWEEYVTRVTDVSRRRTCLLAYTTLTGRHIASYVEGLDAEQHRRVSPYILPHLPTYFLKQYTSKAAVSVAEQQRREEKNAVLLRYCPLLVALIQLRKQAAQQLLHKFREACKRAESGEQLPLDFSYEAVLPEINLEARSVEEVQVEQRRAILQFRLWNHEAWIEQYPEKTRVSTHRDTKKPGRGDDQPERAQYFVQYLGQAPEFLWFGDLVEHGILMRLHGLRQRSHSEDLGEEDQSRLAYARALGVPQGFATDRPGLLTPAGRLEKWLGRTIQCSGAALFDPESLYRGCLFGAALATLALTNGSRVAELLQVSADQFKSSLNEEKENGQLGEKQSVVWFQHLLPKGEKSGGKRQLFLISPQSFKLLGEIGALLKETYGCIPVVYPHWQNQKYGGLKAERYLFQWQATSDGSHGAISFNDVCVLIRFILHGMEFHTSEGEPFTISAHLLRHMMALATRQQRQDPAEVVAIALHHRPVLPATEYYSRMTTRYMMDGEAQAASSIFSLPDERTLAQLVEDIQGMFELRQPLSETTFGFCTKIRPCSCRYNGSFGSGCPYLIPNPARRFAVIKWRDAYARSAGELETAGATEDARFARMKSQALDDLIRTMDLMQQAIDDGTYTPPFIVPPHHGESEEHLDA